MTRTVVYSLAIFALGATLEGIWTFSSPSLATRSFPVG